MKALFREKNRGFVSLLLLFVYHIDIGGIVYVVDFAMDIISLLPQDSPV
jgi:hypothetical protein